MNNRKSWTNLEFGTADLAAMRSLGFVMIDEQTDTLGLRAAVYLRVASMGAETTSDWEAQKLRCLEHVDERGFTLVTVYEDKAVEAM